jgi:hypothetical protein
MLIPAGRAAGPAADTTAGSVKIDLPAHMALNKKFTIKFTGVVPAGQKDFLVMAQDSKACTSSSNAELGRPEILDYVSGAFVKGHFTYVDAGIFLRADPKFLGSVNFCVYLTQGLKTLARTSIRAHLPLS